VIKKKALRCLQWVTKIANYNRHKPFSRPLAMLARDAERAQGKPLLSSFQTLLLSSAPCVYAPACPSDLSACVHAQAGADRPCAM